MNHSSACTSAVQIFNFQSNHAVRVAVNNQDNSIWFCLSDVCNILGVNRRSSEAFKLDEKGCNKIAIPTNGGTQQITFINEPNLYRVIFRSNKKEAVKFQNWVFDEVLPILRKTGSYTIDTPLPTQKPQSPKLSQSDYATVRRAVYFLSKNMYHAGTATNVIYARLRNLCEVEHMADIRYDQLTIVHNELYRIERILRAYTNYRQQTEKTLMSRICMGDSDVVGQAMIDMETTATAYAQVFDEATSAVACASKVAGMLEGRR